MNLKIIPGNEISNAEIKNFSEVSRRAYQHDELDLIKVNPQDIHFMLDDEEWPEAIYGRANIAVMLEESGKGLGKKIIKKMNEFAIEKEMSAIGFHGKDAHVRKNDESTPLLANFYKKCGLEIEEEIGEKMYRLKESGGFKNLAHVNVSYLKGDPLIKATQETERIELPYGW